MGGHGKRTTPKLIARHADGAAWAFVSPEYVKEQNKAVDIACEEIDRDPTDIPRSINLSCYFGPDEHAARKRQKAFETLEIRKEGALLGTPSQVVDTLHRYGDAGITQVNLTFRQDLDDDSLDCFIDEIMPTFA